MHILPIIRTMVTMCNAPIFQPARLARLSHPKPLERISPITLFVNCSQDHPQLIDGYAGEANILDLVN